MFVRAQNSCFFRIRIGLVFITIVSQAIDPNLQGTSERPDLDRNYLGRDMFKLDVNSSPTEE